jgi:RimJ/RimL family protein N-acetyltransferase
MKISYRKLGPVDARQYRGIRLESLKLYPESFGSTFEEQSKLPKLMFEKSLEQPVDDRFVIGAFDQKTLIGICGFIPFVLDNSLGFSNAGEIIQMYVRSAYSGRKIGLGLVKAVIDEAFKISGLEQIVLGVQEGNMSAIRVYEQAGFLTYTIEGSGEEGDVGYRIMVIRRIH